MATKFPVEFQEVRDHPEIVARISSQPAKNGKVTLKAWALYADSKRPCPGCQDVFQLTVEPTETELKRAIDTLCRLVGDDFAKHAHPRALIVGEKKTEKKKTASGEIGIFSIAYYGLPDVNTLFSGWRPSTIKQTKSYFERHILPSLDECANSGITREKLDAIVERAIDRAQKNRRGGHDRNKAAETVSKYLHRFDVILRRLHVYCPHLPPVQFHFSAPSVGSTEKAKALPPKVRIRLAHLLVRLAKKNPLAIGAALMYLLGLRTGEACAVRIGELTIRDGYVVYFVGWQIDSEGNRIETLKSADAYRYTVGCYLAYTLVNMRIAALIEADYTYEEVYSMPLVCDCNDPKKYAHSQDLSAYAKKLILSCGFEEEALAAAETLMQRDPDIVDGERVTEVSAYLLRRDFVSRAMDCCGMDSRDVDYLVGHKRPDKSTRPFSSIDTQSEVAQELEQCVIHIDFSRHPAFCPIMLRKGTGPINLHGSTSYRLQNCSDAAIRVKLRLRTVETGEHLQIATQGRVQAISRILGATDIIRERISRPIILPPYTREMLEAGKEDAEKIDLIPFI